MSMRFIKDGPPIPDDLLIARDEGRVVFFCGAGVSKAQAGLSDFFELTDKVIKTLKVPEDDPAFKILKIARDMSSQKDLSGLISVDSIFGLLEREFDSADIESAVAQVLKPDPGANLSAHQTLLKLAKTPAARPCW